VQPCGGGGLKNPIPRSPWVRMGIILLFAAGVGALLWLRGPNWSDVADAFQYVRWQWVAAAVGLNLLSVIVRSIAWETVISQAMPPPLPTLIPASYSATKKCSFSVIAPGLMKASNTFWTSPRR